MSTPSKWDYFTEEELRCPCCGEQHMDDTFMMAGVLLRRQAGFAFPVTSGYRCPSYNAKKSSTGTTGPHTTGRALDIAVSRGNCFELIRLALASMHITGIGLRQHGNSRFIHLDDLPKLDNRPRPTIWTYT